MGKRRTAAEIAAWVAEFRGRQEQKRRAKNPFRLPDDAPVVLSLSGGRTSGYLLHKELEYYDGRLPGNVIVAFRNMGMEFEKSLEFVDAISRNWGVPIVWLEYRYLRGRPTRQKHSFAVVDFETASRNGEPFDQIIQARCDVRRAKKARLLLPNQGRRYCTGEGKQKTLKRYLTSIGVGSFYNLIGIRADEPQRWQKIVDCRAGRLAGETPLSPLFDAGVDQAEVLEFWKRQPFDLGLPPEESNCTLCFLKSKEKRRRIAAKYPWTVKWWADHEESSGELFRLGQPYKELFSLPVCSADGDEDDEEPCHCTD